MGCGLVSSALLAFRDDEVVYNLVCFFVDMAALALTKIGLSDATELSMIHRNCSAVAHLTRRIEAQVKSKFERSRRETNLAMAHAATLGPARCYHQSISRRAGLLRRTERYERAQRDLGTYVHPQPDDDDYRYPGTY